MNNEQWLNDQRRKANKRLNDIIEVLSIIEKHSNETITIWCKTIIDCETDPDIVNAAKYIMYWLEKTDTVDDPKITKYNDYEEVK